MQKKLKLKALVKRFFEQSEEYHLTQYNEENVRSDFIDEFFKLLDWDIVNKSGFCEQFRDVVKEERIISGDGRKAPDYSFRIGGARQFFVEAKKPAVNIDEEPEPALQLRRYGYSAKLPVSILTNFAEFAVYDTRVKPNKTDSASTARIFYCKYSDYEEQFDFLYNIFSKESILKGKLKTYIQENKHKKGTSEVDAELLKTLESWREDLARNIALRNPEIKVYELNIAVQKIVDRIIFLRIAEDKGIEEYSTLLTACKRKSSFIYSELVDLFSKANTKYNSGLFATIPYLDALTIDDSILKKIIEGLYYPDCPYEFSILPVEILGSIYEQFLGKTIKFRGVKGEKHTAIIEEKPEVKKAGGVYYTPEYIVNYIVERTVGRLIAERMAKPKATIDALQDLTIIDPSCGSGSFLVGAYSYLLKYALEYYSEEKHRKKALKEGKIYQAIGGAYKLTIEEKQRILLNNIFGVDIDEQAVEVAKLSLYLKLLEDEGAEASSRQELFRHTDFKILPSLMNNIQCGNALVGKDYYLKCEEELFSDIEKKRAINVFDWEERFAFIFTNGGFDCVIGNPPYVSAPNQVDNENLKLQRDYLAKSGKYESLYQKWDLYVPFVEKGLEILKNKGIYGAIIPYPFTNQTYASVLRRTILKNYNLLEIADLKGTKVFAQATVTNCIPIIKKEIAGDTVAISHIDKGNNIDVAFEKPISELVIDEKTGVWNLEEKNKELTKHSELHRLGDLCYISKGACINADEKTAKGEFTKDDLISLEEDKKHPRKYIEAKDFSRYSINRIRYLEYGTKRCPAKIRRPTFTDFYEHPKLFINSLGELITVLDLENKFAHNHSITGLCLWKDLRDVDNKSITSSIKKYSHYLREEVEEFSEQVNLYYLLAILNSRYAKHLLAIQRAGSLSIYPEHIRNLPIPIAPKAEMDALTALAKEQLAQHAQLKEAKLESDRSVIQSTIAALDAKIDAIVYKIYGL